MPNALLLKLLETAARDTTPTNERLTAMNKVREISDRHGGLDRVLTGNRSLVTQRDTISNLRRDLADADRRTEKAEEEITLLTERLRRREAELETLRLRLEERAPVAAPRAKPVPDGPMAYSEFAAEARRRLVNADRNWQMVFEEQTGLKRARFARFCNMGEVDSPEYIAALDRLVACEATDRYTKAWTKAEVNRVRALTQEGLSEKAIAELLSGEFKRRITENMLKRLKHNSRNQQGVFRDPGYGPAIGSSR